MISSLGLLLISLLGESSYTGITSCASSPCHGSMTPLNGEIRRNEFSIWSRYDRHSRAYESLLGDRAKKMAEHLKIAAPEKATECLVCHSVPTQKNPRENDFRFSDGVTCEACHGPASSYTKSHVNGKKEQGRFGLMPLGDLKVLASVCSDCHVGNSNSRLQHRLYGAGHPRLRFELNTYLANLPPHFSISSRAAERWLEGQIVRAKRHFEFIHFDSTKKRADLSNYVCSSCHHSLSANEWAHKDYQGKPGELRYDLSSLAMVMGAFRVVEPKSALDLAAALDDPESEKSRKTIERILAAERKFSISISQAREILEQLLKHALHIRFSQDYESAEQIAMGISSLSTHIDPTGNSHRKSLEKLFKTLEDPQHFDPRLFRQILTRVRFL